MVKLGVIEQSDADWSFPVVFVANPGGHLRFCMDYRQPNELTVKVVYQIPRMKYCLESLGDATVFYTLDCDSGYWHIPVAAEDRDKTTFTYHTGNLWLLRLPFGLVNFPASFSHALSIILYGLRWNTCMERALADHPTAASHPVDVKATQTAAFVAMPGPELYQHSRNGYRSAENQSDAVFQILLDRPTKRSVDIDSTVRPRLDRRTSTWSANFGPNSTRAVSLQPADNRISMQGPDSEEGCTAAAQPQTSPHPAK